MTTFSTLTSSRSSWSEICRRSHSSLTGRRTPRRPASIRIDASVTRRAKRSGRIAVSRRAEPPAPLVAGSALALRRDGRGQLDRLGMQLLQPRRALVELLGHLGGRQDPRVLAQAQHPRDEHPHRRVVGDEHDLLAALLAADLAEAAEMALDQPGDPLGDPDLGGALRLAELPVGARGVRARIEVRGPAEVVLGLRRVGDLAPDAAQPEDAQRAALVAVAQEVELAALVEQVVRVDLARADRVALHRVVLERDRLVAEDRGLDLRQALGEVVAAGRAGEPQRDRRLLRRAERRRPPPGELLQREPQRLGVGELAVEQRERRLQARELLVGERDRREVEVLRAQRVVLLLGDAVDRLVDRQLDAEIAQLGAVGVEAPGERVLVHAGVALDVAPDLQRGDRPALRHQVRDQRQLADELLGVLGHRASR